MEKEYSLTTKYVTADAGRCRNCGLCRCKKACPQNVIGKVGSFWHKHSAFIEPDKCNGCMKCVKSCIKKVFTKNQKVLNEDNSLELGSAILFASKIHG